VSGLKFLFVANTPRDSNAGASGCDISTIDALRLLGHEVDEVWSQDMRRRLSHHNLHQWLELPGNFAWVVRDRCRRKDYDVVQVNQPHAWKAAREHQILKRKGVFINRSHGWEPAMHRALDGLNLADGRSTTLRCLSRFLRKRLEKHNQLAANWSDGIVVCSDADNHFIVQNHQLSANRVHTFFPGVPEDFIQTPVSDDSDRWNRVLHVSNFCAPKAPELVAAVYRTISRESAGTELTWVCSAKDHSFVRELLGDASSAVKLLNFMPRVELRSQMDRHGIFLFPSHFEGFGMVFLEAMARGLCVVGTPVGGMDSLIETHANGIRVVPNDPMSAISAVLSLLKDHGKALQFGLAARELASTQTWINSAIQYVGFCAALIETKLKRHHATESYGL